MDKLGESVNLLLIGEDQHQCDLLRLNLDEVKRGGCCINLTCAVGIDAGRKALLAGAYDICVLDYSLTERPGTLLLRDQSGEYALPPFILLIDPGSKTPHDDALRAGAADYLIKGQIDADLLDRVLRYVLRLSRATRERSPARNSHAFLLDHVISAAETSIVVTDPKLPDNPIIYHNAAFERMTGYSAAEIDGKNCRLLQGPDTDPGAVRGIRDALKAERPCNIVLRNYRKDGTPFWNDLALSPVRDARGRVTHFVGVQKDVTVYKKADDERLASVQALRESEARLDGILGSLKDVVWSISATDFNLLYANPALEEVYGRPAAEFFADPELWLKVIHPDDQRKAAEAMGQLLSSGTMEREIRVLRPSGEERWLYDRAVLSRDAATGAPLRLDGIATDVTDRKSAEEALRKNEAHFRTLAQNIPDFVVRYDLMGRHLYVNTSVERITGRSSAEFLGKTHKEMGMSGVVPSGWHDAFRKVKETGREQEYYFKTTTFGTKHYSAKMVPEFGADGTTLVSLLGVTSDVTPAKNVEEELRRQKVLLESQTEASLDGILTVSPEGEIISFNRRFAQMWGLDSETLQTLSDKQTVQKVISQLTDPEAFRSRIEYLYAHPDEVSFEQIRLKDNRIFERYSAPAKGEDGLNYGRLWFFRDVTKREAIETALRASEERFRALTENSSDMVSVLAADGTALYESPSVTVALGYPPEELLGKNVLDLIHPEDQAAVIEALGRLPIGSNFPGKLAYRYRHKDGSWRWMESMGSNQLENPAIRGIVANTRDVTERRRLEQQILHKEKLAALGELVAGVAHEINNPLAAISGHAQLLRLHPDSEVRDDAEVIEKMVQRASRIVRALRSYARASGDDERRTSDLNQVVHSALDVISHKLRQCDVATILDLGKDLPPLSINPGGIEQVIVNLLSNAEQALRDTPAEERFVHIMTRVCTVKPTDSGNSGRICVLAIHDTGAGIPEAARARIFDPFFTTKESGEGTGLGLYISHGIITAHGGTIVAESQKEEDASGTTFTITLPVTEGKQD